MSTTAESAALRLAFGRRSLALGRFAAWEARQIHTSAPAEAIAAATWLYDLLPLSSRVRPVRTEGVGQLHRALSRAL